MWIYQRCTDAIVFRFGSRCSTIGWRRYNCPTIVCTLRIFQIDAGYKWRLKLLVCIERLIINCIHEYRRTVLGWRRKWLRRTIHVGQMRWIWFSWRISYCYGTITIYKWGNQPKEWKRKKSGFWLCSRHLKKKKNKLQQTTLTRKEVNKCCMQQRQQQQQQL